MSNRVQNPYEIFTDVDGTPLEGGYIYIGEEGLNPISNPQQAYWDSDLTIPASNIRTSGGYPSYNGSPGRLYVADAYSITVRNSRDDVVFSSISPAEDTFDTVICTSLIASGSNGSTTISEDRMLMSRADTNYIWANSVGGSIALGTNGRARDPSEASVVLLANKTINVPSTLTAGGLITSSLSATVGVVDDISSLVSRVDTIMEYSSGEGVGLQAEGSVMLKNKVIDIGDWDMDSTTSVSISHGLLDIGFIRGMAVTVRKDSDVTLRMDPISNGGDIYVEGANVILTRDSAGIFDTTEYDETSYNRGWITITYEV